MAKFAEHLRNGSRALAGLVLIIFAVAFSAAVYAEAGQIAWRERNPALFGLGAGVFALIHLLFQRRPFLYVFAHEISHALACALS
ncbi:MAG: hypothetical protein HY714_05425, partial [Candidatus Omnitrophica bacterium]|nr:hypothetical protein [Candidatus Omnitrophota bacterium]